MRGVEPLKPWLLKLSFSDGELLVMRVNGGYWTLPLGDVRDAPMSAGALPLVVGEARDIHPEISPEIEEAAAEIVAYHR